MTLAALQRRPPAASVVAAADGRSRAHRCTSVGVAMALFAGSPTALAAPAEPLPSVEDEPAPSDEPKDDAMLTRAMAAYERGQENYKLAQYEAALADFQEASSLYASPDFQYNIGLCYEKLGRYDQAVLAYATYLKVKPDADDRASVETTIKRLQAIIEQQKEAPTTTPAPQPEGPTDTPPERDPSKPLIISGAVLLGVGAAVGLGGGIAFGVLARNRSRALDDVQDGGNPDDLTFAEAQDLESSGKRFEGVQIGMAVGGAAVAVVGGVLLALGLRKKNKQATASASMSLAPGTAGLVLGGRF